MLEGAFAPAIRVHGLVTTAVLGLVLAAPGLGHTGDSMTETSAEILLERRAPDADRDGVPDSDDNCPDHRNADQADVDDDGLGDVCDDPLAPQIRFSRPTGSRIYLHDDGGLLPSPTGYPIVLGDVTVCAQVTDDVSVEAVEIKLNGFPWIDLTAASGAASDATSEAREEYCHSFSSADLHLGNNFVRLRARDDEGRQTSRGQFFTALGSGAIATSQGKSSFPR